MTADGGFAPRRARKGTVPPRGVRVSSGAGRYCDATVQLGDGKLDISSLGELTTLVRVEVSDLDPCLAARIAKLSFL